jgi:hypothetical protein
MKASEKLGIDIGKRGSRPGAFYEFPGRPMHAGTGLPNVPPRPR